MKKEDGFIVDDLMLICSFRYCLGRKTYVVRNCVDHLKKHWNKLNRIDKTLIQKEIKECDNLGFSCDIQDWNELLRLSV